MSGLTQTVTIEWKSIPGGSALISDDTNYVIGGAGFDSGQYESILTVKAIANTADQTYYCAVTSSEWAKTNDETHVVLNVFGML